MKLGIIGLPGAGKTTIFNALTKGDAPTGQSMGGRFDVHTAVVDVLDARIDVLTRLFKPRKTTYARITFTDVAGLSKGANESGGMSGALLNHLSALDGFVHVVRAFEHDMIPHPDGSVNPQRDLEALNLELLLNDLGIAERRAQKLKEQLGKGAAKDKAAAQVELALFDRLTAALAEGQTLRDLEIAPDELKLLRSYGFLTLKPQIIVTNLGDDQEPVAVQAPQARTVTLPLRGKLEMELAQLSRAGDLETVAIFMEEFGIAELSLDLLVRACYDLLGLLSFFTVGEDEVRAWTLQRGETALEAAAAIHTDLAKGFIRAETVHYDELIAAGGLAEARAIGKLRQEGRTYVMQDGDIINVKFNV